MVSERQQGPARDAHSAAAATLSLQREGAVTGSVTATPARQAARSLA